MRDFIWIVVAYVAAIAVAAVVVVLTPDLDPLWRAALGDVAATLVIFGFSCVFRNASFYDAYWSVVPPVLWLYWAWVYEAWHLESLLVGAVVIAWAIRLTHNWARGWQGLTHVDWRYVDLKEKTGKWYPLVDLFGLELMPTVLVFLGCIPIYITMRDGTGDAEVWQWAWFVVGACAVLLELKADNELKAHRDAVERGPVLRSGVWAWCRHPNYLGELGFWLSLALAGTAAVNGFELWNWVGFAVMVVLFVAISIPMLEKRQLEAKPEYEDYVASVPMLIPRPW